MEPTPYSKERLIAELAVQRVSVLAKRIMREMLAAHDGNGAITKSDSTPVTVADFAGQALMIAALHHAFPTDRFIGEEGAEGLRNDSHLRARVWELVSSARLDDPESDALLASPKSEEEMLELIDRGLDPGGKDRRIWIMDPIDGTATFLKGQQYAVSLALVVDGREEIGVLGCPNLRGDTLVVRETVVDDTGFGVMVSAVRGQGALLRLVGTGGLDALPRVLPKFHTNAPSRTSPHFVDSHLSTSCRLDLAARLAGKLGSKYPDTDVWSSHIKYMALILGGGDVMVQIPRKGEPPDDHIWDHAGAQLIFSELGGEITDLDGKEIDLGAGRRLASNWGLLAAKPGVGSKVLELIRDLKAVEDF
ncbi:hypothetical protein F5X68DRAFT_208902 [Plectosphaerella plurivora]|uniref:3'(2'),5'-bisphosphate nucleotidase n=1 Tax=Plectosphaerella plurivora TaxID=936078 RepID=A0A9P9ABA1_9PEZI|nr:hypothetical protein F5X68DRAFT_208902 [Plectosphaerella plurivora]